VRCRDFREIADSYLGDELLVETNHEVIRHLESCADCRKELTARRALRSKLREAFQHAPNLQPSDEFVVRLKAQLRDVALSRSRFSPARAAYVAVAASLVIAAALGFRVVYQRWHSQKPPYVTSDGNRNEKTDHVSNGGRRALVNAALTESAIGDHRDCALNHRLAEKPIDLDEAGRKYDSAYINLVRTVVSEGTLPVGVQFVGGHSCVFSGRRFGHVILKYKGELVSVLITKIETQDQVAPTSAGQLFGNAQSDGYRLAYFETERHAVYVVSGLNEIENLSIAQAIAPSVSRHLRDAERTA
jgi:anti-sigma factor RsiW